MIYPHLALDGLEPGAREELLTHLLEREEEQLAAGQPSYYTAIVAQKE